MKKLQAVLVIMLVIILGRSGLAALSPMVPRGIRPGSSVDQKYADSLVVFTRQHIYFMPWLEEIRKKAEQLRPDFTIYIYMQEHPEQIRNQGLLQRYQGAPEFFQSGGCQVEAIVFENEQYPSFYLFDEENQLIYKHLGFAVSDWYVLDEVLHTYLSNGELPERLQEYNFELHSTFPVITMEDFRGKSYTIKIAKPTMLLISPPFPGEESKQQILLDLFVRLYEEFAEKVDFYVILQYDTKIEYEQFREYCKRYGIELSWKKENTFFKTIKRNRQMRNLPLPVLVDKDREVWRKLGYPATGTIGIFDAEGELADFRCASCDIYNNIEAEYRELLYKLLEADQSI